MSQASKNMNYNRQLKRNSQLPVSRGKRDGVKGQGDSLLHTSSVTQQSSSAVTVQSSANNINIKLKSCTDNLKALLSSVSKNREQERNISGASSDLFEEGEDVEFKLIKENDERVQRIGSVQRQKKEMIPQHEKKRMELKEKQTRDKEYRELIRSKIDKIETNIGTINNQKLQAFDVSTFYEPFFKHENIDPKNPICGEGKPILPVEGSTLEICDFWNCPKNVTSEKSPKAKLKT